MYKCHRDVCVLILFYFIFFFSFTERERERESDASSLIKDTDSLFALYARMKSNNLQLRRVVVEGENDFRREISKRRG